MKKNIIIVGGGILGIFTALLLKKSNNNVLIIEQNKKLGGLFLSTKSKYNLFFDTGCHFARETGIKKIDQILFDKLSKKKWNILGNLKCRGYFNSKLSKDFGALDARLINKKNYLKGIKQYLNQKNKKKITNNLEQQLFNKFGKYFTNKIFRPIIEKKITGTKLKYLPVNLHRWAGLGRIVLFNPEKTRQLKKQIFFDETLAYHNTSEGQTKLKNFYPKYRGIDLWIKILEKKLRKKGVNILINRKIVKINILKNKIQSIMLDNNKTINCTKVIWTINPMIFSFYLKKIKKKFGLNLKKIHFFLQHFTFNKKLNSDAEFIQCHDSKLKTYRVSLYPNMNKVKKKFHNLTSEIIFHKPKDSKIIKKLALKELRKIGVIEKKHKILESFTQSITQGVPVPTINSLDTLRKFSLLTEKKIKNINFINTNPLLSTGENIINCFNMMKKLN